VPYSPQPTVYLTCLNYVYYVINKNFDHSKIDLDRRSRDFLNMLHD